MSSELEQSPRGWLQVALIPGVIVVVFVVGYFVVRGRGTQATVATPARVAVQEDELRDARDALVREPELASCKAAIGKINTHLNQHSEDRPPAVKPEELAKLGERYGLDQGELAEVENTSFTPLDARYLDECLLFRDAARSLDSEDTNEGGKTYRPAPVERAMTAFRWVVRQVRALPHGEAPLPPAFVLRRGWGNALERALVFLALLQQDSGPEQVRGCLLSVPDKDGKPQLWACGVTVGDDKKIYLFDTRAGLPLPGPKGEGVATLDAAVKDPSVLSQLDAGPDEKYDVTAERARSAEGFAVVSLSALAPRMRHLQENLLKNGTGARLAADTSAVDSLQDAVKAAGAKGAAVWKEGVGLSRRFLPTEEGGIDGPAFVSLSRLPGFTRPDDRTQVRLTRQQFYEWEMVPWAAMPGEFNPVDFPITVGLGQRVRQLFKETFTRPLTDPHGARELLLRGKFTRALPILVDEDSSLREHSARRDQEKNLDRGVAEWLKEAREAYADLQRSQNSPDAAARTRAAKHVEALWDPHKAAAVYILLFGASSGPRDAEVTYQLGLCKQEQAEQYQSHIDLMKREGGTPPASDLERCKQAWIDAKGWWERVTADYGQGALGPSARLNRGRAESMLGDWEAAAATWGDVRGMSEAVERLAAKYRSREAKKHGR